MAAGIHKISVWAGRKHTLSSEESFRRSVSSGKLRSQQITREYACHYGGEDNKLKCNCYNQTVRTQQQQLQNGLKHILWAVTFQSWDTGPRRRVRGRGGGRTPEHYARALCCNMAGPFQICFLWACSLPISSAKSYTLQQCSVQLVLHYSLCTFLMQLKDACASPGGTTICGLQSLEKSGFRSALMEAVKSATERAEELRPKPPKTEQKTMLNR